MIECPNVEMRDRLPDLANGSLDAATQALVLAHLAACAGCTIEIEIIRSTRVVLVQATPRVNVDAIVRALPHPGSVVSISSAPSVRRRSSWATSWRAAAGIALVATGLGGYALVKDGGVAPVDSGTIVTMADGSGLALTGALVDLTDAELDALVKDIGDIEALPSAEVETGHSVVVPTILPDSVVRDQEVR
jgi:hypothetical protein